MSEYSLEFIRAVAHLRGIAPWFRALALHAADHWSDEEFADRMATVPVPGEFDTRADTTEVKTIPNLKIVR